jgi:hypothetical protein
VANRSIIGVVDHGTHRWTLSKGNEYDTMTASITGLAEGGHVAWTLVMNCWRATCSAGDGLDADVRRP